MEIDFCNQQSCIVLKRHCAMLQDSQPASPAPAVPAAAADPEEDAPEEAAAPAAAAAGQTLEQLTSAKAAAEVSSSLMKKLAKWHPLDAKHVLLMYWAHASF